MIIRHCPKEVKTIHDEVRDPNNLRLPHEQLHAALSSATQGKMTVPDSLHARAFKQKVPLIMYSMQGAVLAQALVPWDTRTPARDNRRQMHPHPKMQQHAHAASSQRLHQKSTRRNKGHQAKLQASSP